MGRYDPEQQERLSELNRLSVYTPNSLLRVAQEAERIAREHGMEWTYPYVVAAVLQEQGRQGLGE
jgi:hypothetical protein